MEIWAVVVSSSPFVLAGDADGRTGAGSAFAGAFAARSPLVGLPEPPPHAERASSATMPIPAAKGRNFIATTSMPYDGT